MKIKKGDYVMVVDRLYGHDNPIGSICKVIEEAEYSVEPHRVYRIEDKTNEARGDMWAVNTKEVTPILQFKYNRPKRMKLGHTAIYLRGQEIGFMLNTTWVLGKTTPCNWRFVSNQESKIGSFQAKSRNHIIRTLLNAIEDESI